MILFYSYPLPIRGFPFGTFCQFISVIYFWGPMVNGEMTFITLVLLGAIISVITIITLRGTLRVGFLPH